MTRPVYVTKGGVRVTIRSLTNTIRRGKWEDRGTAYRADTGSYCGLLWMRNLTLEEVDPLGPQEEQTGLELEEEIDNATRPPNTTPASPLSSPQHRRHLREAARLELRAVAQRWLAMGTDPQAIAEACEGLRVDMMDEARKRGRQG